MGEFLVGMANAFIRGLGAVVTWVFALLPPSPFTLIDSSPISGHIAMFNWFVPVNILIAITEAWLVAVGTFYLYMIILRWIKALG